MSNSSSLRWRRLNHFYAWLHGYFWVPCPLCGRMFGGHEYGPVSVPVPGRPGTGWLTCKLHK
jgi:hypothetical protein